MRKLDLTACHSSPTLNDGHTRHIPWHLCESHSQPTRDVSVLETARYADTYASFWSYCQAEVNFNMKGTSSSSLFGETTRDKLYNSLFLVGPHLERYMAVGFLKCLDYLLVGPRSVARACTGAAPLPAPRSSAPHSVCLRCRE